MPRKGKRKENSFHGCSSELTGPTAGAMNVLSFPKLLAQGLIKTEVSQPQEDFDAHPSSYKDDLMKPRILMLDLECPFTWDSPVLCRNTAHLLEDRLPLAARPWEAIIMKCHLAYSAFKQGSLKKSQSFIAECFMPLLDVPGFQTECDVTRLYWQAIKHVLDGTSAFIQQASCEDQESLRDLDSFVRGIPSFGSMGHKNQAAVHAIRSKLCSYPANKLWAELAIEMNPEEAQWHTYLSELLFEADQQYLIQYQDEEKEREKVFKDILKHCSEAMMQGGHCPDAFALMAKILIGDQSSSDDMYMILQNALKKFPDSAFLYEKAADFLVQSQPSFDYLPKSYLLIEPFYKKALKLAGKEVLSIRYKLGAHQVSLGQLKLENYEGTYEEGLENLKIASVSIPNAKKALDDAMAGRVDVSDVRARLLNPLYLRYEEDSSSSEESHPDIATSKKKKEKSRKVIHL